MAFFNMTISHVHCWILWSPNHYFINNFTVKLTHHVNSMEQQDANLQPTQWPFPLRDRIHWIPEPKELDVVPSCLV